MDLKKLREEINHIDEQLLSLLHNRAEISKKVGSLKADTGGDVHVPLRENEILYRLKNLNHGIYPEAAIEKIWREIFSASRSVQHPNRIAFLGPSGSFGHMASLSFFGMNSVMIPITPQTDIFTEVETDRADFGVVAIQNSVFGTVRDVLERFQRTSLQICAEIYHPIRHHLISRSPLNEIKRIYSHSQPFAQCRIWLNKNMKSIEQVEVVSTSEAAKRAADEQYSAAIASELASEIYEVPVIVDSIMDEPNNSTRFLVIGNQIIGSTGNDCTSIFFEIRDRVGALYEILGVLKKHNLSLDYLESMPSRSSPWEYIFFADIIGHLDDDSVHSVLTSLDELCQDVKILGSYPRGTK